MRGGPVTEGAESGDDVAYTWQKATEPAGLCGRRVAGCAL